MNSAPWRAGDRMKKLLLVVALALVALVALSRNTGLPQGGRVEPGRVSPGHEPTEATERGRDGDQALSSAFENHESNVIVEGQGIVAKVLRDDRDGSRHQRFILRLGSGQTLLVAHNIDLSRRIESLQAGETVAFRGEYEWNAAGGVIHWTHADPDGRHPAGWIKYQGETYR